MRRDLTRCVAETLTQTFPHGEAKNVTKNESHLIPSGSPQRERRNRPDPKSLVNFINVNKTPDTTRRAEPVNLPVRRANRSKLATPLQLLRLRNPSHIVCSFEIQCWMFGCSVFGVRLLPLGRDDCSPSHLAPVRREQVHEQA